MPESPPLVGNIAGRRIFQSADPKGQKKRNKKIASLPTRQRDKFRQPCSEITRCNGIDYCWCFVFLEVDLGRPTEVIREAPQKSPRTCRVSVSLEPWQNVDHGASSAKQCTVRACHSCCFRENPTNHERHRDGI